MSTLAAPAPAKALLERKDLIRVLTLLDCDGEEARLVGGALRNALLHRPVEEFDIATTATPETVIARAEAAKLKSVPTGLSHGTVMLIVEGRPFEVTSLREDIETDGRHAKVRFSRDFEADAKRRDFTMNALSMTRGAMLFDYVGGLADIEARKLRFIGDPAARIREDYLRILRFFRFAAAYAEGPLDQDAVLACLRARDGLARLSRERVRNEILKLLAAPRAGEVTREFCETGLLGPLLASAPNPLRLINLLRFTSEETRDPLLGLAALCVNLPENALRLRERLRLSNPETERLVEAAAAFMTLHGLEKPPPAPASLRLIFRYGRQAACDALALAAAESDADVAPWREALAYARAAKQPRLPFSGADLLARGVAEGKAIGDALNDLQARWIEAGFPEDPRRLAELLEEVVAAANGSTR
ncbi:MAG TPA: CCA tRNA nucleotidyltransferase [Methylovirgula sp.]|nr:CCA tRNA nucleotidyltransferase [Methylovirgula sp.]